MTTARSSETQSPDKQPKDSQATEAKLRRLELELTRARELVENQYVRMEVMEARLNPDAGPAKHDDAVSLSATSYQVSMLDMVQDVSLNYYDLDKILPRSTVNPGLSCYGMGRQVDLVIAVLVFGHDLSKIEQIVQKVVNNQQRTRAFKPVFFTDHPVFTPFRRTRLVYEYFPKASQVKAVDVCAEAYENFQKEKFVFGLNKWGIETVLDMSKACPFPLS